MKQANESGIDSGGAFEGAGEIDGDVTEHCDGYIRCRAKPFDTWTASIECKQNESAGETYI